MLPYRCCSCGCAMAACSVCRKEFPYSNGLALADATLCSPACLGRWGRRQGQRAEKITMRFDSQHRMAIQVLMGKEWVRRAT